MELFFIIALTIALYVRTLHYKYHPDDAVPRKEYLYNVPEKLPPQDFLDKRPHVRVRLWCIANHCLNVALVHYLFGWQAALIFAVHPVAVDATAWVTGNYYAGTTFLALTAYFFIDSFGWMGTIPAMAFYWGSLNSTITGLGLPIFFAVTGNLAGLVTFLPMFAYFKSKRFRVGIELRKNMRGTEWDKIEPRKFAHMTKIVAEYVIMFFLPLRMALFREYGEYTTRTLAHYERDCTFNKHFWKSFAICGALLLGGLVLNWQAVLWFFVFLAPQSQFKCYGQGNATNRYLYLPMIGLAILVSYLPMPLYYAIVGILVYRTWLYTPAWKDIGSVHLNCLENFPGRSMSWGDYAQWIICNYVILDDKDPKKDMNRLNQAGYLTQEALRRNIDHDSKYEIFEVYVNAALYFSNIKQIYPALKFTEDAMRTGAVQNMGPYMTRALEGQHRAFNKIISDLKQKEKKDALMGNNKSNIRPVPAHA